MPLGPKKKEAQNIIKKKLDDNKNVFVFAGQ